MNIPKTWQGKAFLFFRLLFLILLMLPHHEDGEWLWGMMGRQILVAFATVGIFATIVPLGAVQRLLRGIGGLAQRCCDYLPDTGIALAAAVLFFVLTCTLSDVLFSHLTHVTDSTAQYIQAKIFASGHLTLARHPLQTFFTIQYFSNESEQIYSSFPPGHSLLLALGMLAGAPWAINPLLGAFFIMAVFFLGKEVGGTRAVGLVCVALAFVSPFIVYMSSEYMNHATALLMETLYLLFYFRMLNYGLMRDGMFAGMALGYLGITRPQCVIILSFIFVPHALWLCYKNYQKYIPLCLSVGLGGLPFACFFLYYNYVTNGSPLLTGYEAVQTGPYASMTTWFTWWTKGTFPLGDFRRALWQSGKLGLEFFCWPISSFLLMGLLFLYRPRLPFVTLLSCLFFANFVFLMIIYPAWNQLFGSRYLYESSGVVIVLTAVALTLIPNALQHWLQRSVDKNVWVGAMVVMCVCFTVSGLLGRTGRLYAIYGSHYWEGNADYYHAIEQHVKTPAIVFIADATQFNYVATALPPQDSSPIIFARSQRGKNKQLMDYYPDRHVYSVVNKRQMPPLPDFRHDPCVVPPRVYLAGPNYYMTEIR